MKYRTDSSYHKFYHSLGFDLALGANLMAKSILTAYSKIG